MVKALRENYPALRVEAGQISSMLANKRSHAEKYDLVLAYGPIDAIQESEAYDLNELIDVIFVAPQVAYLFPLKQEILKDYPIILKLIDKKIFGTMNGIKASGDLLDELVTLDLERSYASAKCLETKNSDKNIELLAIGLDPKGKFAPQFVAALESSGIRTQQEKYRLDTLYRSQSSSDYDIRLLTGYSHMLEKEDMGKISRKIDGLIYVAGTLSEAKVDWFRDYQIPIYILTKTEELQHDFEFSDVQDFLLEVAEKTEYSSETFIARFDAAPPERQKRSFLGIIEWCV
jgi:cellobiose-specific phosphotransferase system component IIB